MIVKIHDATGKAYLRANAGNSKELFELGRISMKVQDVTIYNQLDGGDYEICISIKEMIEMLSK